MVNKWSVIQPGGEWSVRTRNTHMGGIGTHPGFRARDLNEVPQGMIQRKKQSTFGPSTSKSGKQRLQAKKTEGGNKVEGKRRENGHGQVKKVFQKEVTVSIQQQGTHQSQWTGGDEILTTSFISLKTQTQTEPLPSTPTTVTTVYQLHLHPFVYSAFPPVIHRRQCSPPRRPLHQNTSFRVVFIHCLCLFSSHPQPCI